MILLTEHKKYTTKTKEKRVWKNKMQHRILSRRPRNQVVIVLETKITPSERRCKSITNRAKGKICSWYKSAIRSSNRRIFCDVICCIWLWTVIHLPSKTKCSEYWKNKITRSSPAILSPISQITHIWRGFKNPKFYSGYMTSLSIKIFKTCC